ncbi:MAG: filamentous hemagglutinin N-terminal domain-containing protein [Rhodocyclales bacterium]|nr:filamentous hemagglutinin N-terminal domain-containing protein [Rhodocyclales bacterium]
MKLRHLAILSSAVCIALPALAAPTAPVVASGTATFNQPGNVLTVTNSNGAIINWSSFNIAPGQAVQFVQPSTSSAVLNRVMNDPSAIIGKLSSNGRVWLVNPAGIIVGPGGRINTNAIVRLPAPTSALTLPPGVATAALPSRAVAPAAGLVNAGRMVDGAVTLRMSLVDASPIVLR